MRRPALACAISIGCAGGGSARDAPEAPAACASLDALARCVHDGITSLQREPVRGELAVFVTEARVAGVATCNLDDDGSSVAWDRRESSVSHHDDGTFELHIEYRFQAHGCPPATMLVDLTAGTPGTPD